MRQEEKDMSGRVILHSDINCCYAAIEHLHHPELNGKPLAVGGDPESRHGIVLTADYIAKKYGVKTGMALWQAKQLCPEITFVSPRMDLYLRFSRMAHEIYAEYTDLQEAYGIDESWLDVTDSATIKGDGYSIAKEISNRMKSELGITVSIGVSFNKIFAKLGSDYKKPDAITTMYTDEFQTKAWNLPVGDLLYVGRSTNQKLAKIGIRTIGDLARTDEAILVSQLGKMGSVLWAFANGYDDSPVRKENAHAPIKSVGNSTTTHRDLVNDEDVKIVIYVLAESVAARLRENGFRCRVVEISIRDKDLFSFTRQRKISNATNITEEIAVEAYKLFMESYDWRKPIRSVGVRGADLVNDNYWEQIDLFCDFQMREKHMKMDAAVDDIRRRFGFYSIQRGLMYQDKVLSAVNAKEDHTVHPHGYFNQ
jgi:DNA polymerase-4